MVVQDWRNGDVEELPVEQQIIRAGSAQLRAEDAETLRRIGDSRVRQALAGNKATPVSVLEALCSDPDPIVRGTLTSSGRLPGHILERLAADEDDWVVLCAAKLQCLPESCYPQVTLRGGDDLLWALSMNQGMPLRGAYPSEELGAYRARFLAHLPPVLERAAKEHQVPLDVLTTVCREWDGTFREVLDAVSAL